jgi:hypothetical protein
MTEETEFKEKRKDARSKKLKKKGICHEGIWMKWQ